MVFWLPRHAHAKHRGEIPTALAKLIIAIKEPSGLVRDDGKRPDGSMHTNTLAGWQITGMGRHRSQYSGRVLYLNPGGAAEHAAARKSAKYSSLPSSHIFNHWLWRPSVPSTQPESHSFPSWAADWPKSREIIVRLRISSRESHWRSNVTIRWHSEAPSRSPPNWTSATPACFVFNFCFWPPGSLLPGVLN